MTGFRWPALLLLPALIVAALILDSQRPDPEPVEVASARIASSIRPDSASAATWFCVAGVLDETAIGGTDDGLPEADDSAEADEPVPVVTSHIVSVVNASTEDRNLRVAEYTADTPVRVEPEPSEMVIGPGETVLLTSENVGSVMVESDGGGVYVEHETGSELGSDSSPCASTSSSRWEFPGGETVQGSYQTMVVFNPFPEDAVAQLAFSSDTGRRVPALFEAAVIPGRSFRVFDVSSEVTQATHSAATIDVRSGRVIAQRIIIRTPRRRGSGLSSTTGAPGASLVSYLPIAQATPSRSTSVLLYNPSEDRAEVDVELRIDDIVIPAFEVPLPALARQRLDLSEEPRLQELLEGEREYALIVRSANGVPVASELEYTSIAVGDDATVEGIAAVVGSSVAATRWLVGAPLTVEGDEVSSLALLNPSFDTIAQVTVEVLEADGNRRSAQTIELGAGGRRRVSFAELGIVSSATVIVESNSPIVAGRELVSLSSISMALGMPDASTLAVESNGIGFDTN